MKQLLSYTSLDLGSFVDLRLQRKNGKPTAVSTTRINREPKMPLTIGILEPGLVVRFFSSLLTWLTMTTDLPAAPTTGFMPLSPVGLIAVASGGTTLFTSGTLLPERCPDSGITGLTGICPPSGTKGLTGMLSGALAIGFNSLNKLMV